MISARMKSGLHPPSTRGLVAYYAFENNTEDGSGNGFHGTIVGGPSSLLIGSDGWRCDWIGTIDDVRIYDLDLSEAEVLELASK